VDNDTPYSGGTVSVIRAAWTSKSMPTAFGANRRPMGLETIASHTREVTMLDVANVYKTKTDWYLRIPSPSRAAIKQIAFERLLIACRRP
jgi:Asp-tRNA(Asn)/Glu-tRNA(Gln) amidotransferase A subunit family amidase